MRTALAAEEPEPERWTALDDMMARFDAGGWLPAGTGTVVNTASVAEPISAPMRLLQARPVNSITNLIFQRLTNP